MIALLDAIPPKLCRLLARRNGKIVSERELAALSGLSRTTVRRIIAADSWAGITVGEATAFSQACGVDLINQARDREFIRRRKWAHVTGARGKKSYLKLIQEVKSCRKN